MTTWFVRGDGKIRGPFNPAQIRQFLARGIVLAHHELSADRLRWVRLADHPELGNGPGDAPPSVPGRSATGTRMPPPPLPKTVLERQDDTRCDLNRPMLAELTPDPPDSDAGRPSDQGNGQDWFGDLDLVSMGDV